MAAPPPPPPPPPPLPPLPPLTAQEIATFIREGFLIKRAVLDAELCHQALDHMWDLNTSRQLQRGAPASWAAPIRPDDESADPMNLRRGDHWRLRGLCSTKLVLDMFPRRIWPWFQQLAGEDLVAPREGSRRGWNNWGGYETRGIYNVLSSAAAPGPPDDVPTTEGGAQRQMRAMAAMVQNSAATAIAAGPARAGSFSGGASTQQVSGEGGQQQKQLVVADLHSAHVDPQPSIVVAACYLDDVPVEGGGFCIFPRSHHVLHDLDAGFADVAHASYLYAEPGRGLHSGTPPDQLKFVGNPRFKPQMAEAVAEAHRLVTTRITPLEISGGVGDVILTHGRLWHMGSANTVPGTLRSAMFYDVVQAETDRQFHAQTDDSTSPARDRGKWRGWSTQVQRASAAKRRNGRL
jgi:hypothetical protein